MTLLPGIDVSNYQGQPDWSAIAGSGMQFAAVMFTQGAGPFVDVDAASDWAALKANGMARIAYHYCVPSQNATADEVAWFLKNLSPLEVGDCIWCDLEDDPSGPTGTEDYSAWLIAWLQAVEAALGFKPILYARAEYLVRHNCANNPTIMQYGLAIAAYQGTAPTNLDGWPFFAFWQSGTGTVPGVAGPCDLDWFNGTVDQLRLYGLQTVTPPPVKPTPTNNDLVYFAKFLFNPSGPDLAGLNTAIAPFL